MAVTIAQVKQAADGNSYETIVDITGPASYTTTGEALTAAQVNQLCPRLGGGLAATAADIGKITSFTSERTATGIQCVLDRTNVKMMYFAAGAEAGAGSNQSTFAVRATVRY